MSFYPLDHKNNRHSLHDCTTDIDYIRLSKVYEHLFKISDNEEGVFDKIFKESIRNITEQMQSLNKVTYKFMSKALTRILILWLSQDQKDRFYDPTMEEYTTLIASYFYDVEGLKCWDRQLAAKYLSTLDTEYFLTICRVSLQQVTFLMFDQPEDDTEEIEKVRRYFLLIDFFYTASRIPKIKKISVKEFHNDLLNREWTKELPNHYLAWYDTRRNISDDDMETDDINNPVTEIDKRTGKFRYVCYPWAFDAASKARFMNYEGQLSRRRELHNSINIFALLNGGMNIYLEVAVDRETLIDDALNILVNSGKNLKKPLKVKFKGEPGVDEGGVQKEFFQLLVRKLFDVEYGMFDYNTESKLYWFKKDTFEIPLKFELIGIILGLAIYNGNILDIHFPQAVYKKLLDREVTLEDFAQYDPQVAKSLKSILNYDKDDFKEVMQLTFTVDFESWGAKVSEELKEGGRNIDVTNDNKEEYVDLFIDYMMNKSIEKYFNAFKKGFDK